METLTRGGSLDPVVGTALEFLRAIRNGFLGLGETGLTGGKVVSIPLNPVVSTSLVNTLGFGAGFVDLSNAGLRERGSGGDFVALNPVVSAPLVLLAGLSGRFFKLRETGLALGEPIPFDPVVGTSFVDSGRLGDTLLDFGDACLGLGGRCGGGGSRGGEEGEKLEELHVGYQDLVLVEICLCGLLLCWK